MTSVITRVRELVSKDMNNNTRRRIILKQIALLTKMSSYISDKVQYLSSRSKSSTVSNRLMSRKWDFENRNSILESKQKQVRGNYIHTEDNILSNLISENYPKIPN